MEFGACYFNNLDMGGYWEVLEQYVVLCLVGDYFRREHAYWS
tara:strand:- start:451 stop:576 length:126 start_codon:yes stop_codon:yes gene_type:complete